MAIILQGESPETDPPSQVSEGTNPVSLGLEQLDSKM